MRHLQLLLALKDHAQLGTITDLLFDQIAFVQSQPGGTYRLTVRDAISREISPTMGVPEFDAVLDLGVPDGVGSEPLVQAALALRPELTPLIDGSRSGAILGPEAVIVPGVGPLQLFRCLHRKQGLTLKEFSDHLLHIHGELGKRTPGKIGYRQIHRDPEPQRAVTDGLGLAFDEIDGLSHLFFEDEQGVALLGSDPELAQETYNDGVLFNDRSKAMGMIARVIAAAGPMP